MSFAQIVPLRVLNGGDAVRCRDGRAFTETRTAGVRRCSRGVAAGLAPARARRAAGAPGRSGCAPLVSMVEAADLGDRHDVAIAGRRDRTRNRGVLVERQVRARPFVAEQ